MNKKKLNILILTLILVFSANIALSIIQHEVVNYNHKADNLDELNSAPGRIIKLQASVRVLEL